MQQLRLRAKLYVHNRNGIFKCKSKGYITTWFVFSVVVAASLYWAGFVLLRELWVTEDQRNPFTLQFTYVHQRVEGDFSWQFIKFLSNFVKPVTNSKYVFHVQVKGNQNQICESEDQKSLQYNIEISKENNEIMKIWKYD